MWELTRITYVWNRDKDMPTILMWGRNEKGECKMFTEDYRPYFYKINNIDSKYAMIGEEVVALDGRKVKKVSVKLIDKPLDATMAELRGNGDDTYESHVRFVLRYLVDKGITSGFDDDLKPVDVDFFRDRIIYVDIEVAIEPTEKISIEPRWPIVAISWYDNYTGRINACMWSPNVKPSVDMKKVTISTKNNKEEFDVIIYRMNNERDMLRFFVSYVKSSDPDILTGWNVSKGYVYGKYRTGFDFPYLIGRMASLGIDYSDLSPIRVVTSKQGEISIKGRNIVDLMVLFELLQKPTEDLPSWSLAYVAERFVGIKSEERKPWIKKLWETEPEKVLQHNVLDVIKEVLIDKYVGVLEQFDMRRKIIGCTWDELQFDVRIGEILCLRERGPPIPDRWISEIYSSYQGAYVKTPPVGRFENVAQFDIKMAYPSAIRIFNIGPDTLIQNGNIPIVLYKGDKTVIKRVGFRKDVDSIIKKVVMRLAKLREKTREELKKEQTVEGKKRLFIKDRSCKFLICAMYGIMGNPGFWLFNQEAAAAVTSVVRDILKKTEEYIESLGCKVLYIDTDGIYVQMRKDINPVDMERNINEFIQNYIRDRYGYDDSFKVEYSTGYEAIFFRKRVNEKSGTKKVLAGKVIWKDGKEIEPYVEIIGMMARETSLPKISVMAQRKIIDMILNGKSKVEIADFTRKIINDFRLYRLEDIAIPRAMGSETYINPPPWVRGILYSVKHFGHPAPAVGQKIYYLWVERVIGGYPTDVVGWTDISYIPRDRLVIDEKKMIDAIFVAPLEPLLSSYGINWVAEGLPIPLSQYQKMKKKKKVKPVEGQVELTQYV